MKTTIITVFTLSLLITGCSTINEVVAPLASSPMTEIDSLYIGLPILKGHQSLDACIKDYDQLLLKIPQTTIREGLVKTLLAISADGKLKGVKALDNVSPVQDSIAVSILLETVFQPSYTLEGLKGDYAVEVIFPFVKTEHDDNEYQEWYKLPAGEKNFHVPPQPRGGYAAIQRSVLYPTLAREFDIRGTVEIKLFIDSNGKSGRYEVWKSIGYGMDWAAIYAIKKADWTPAKRDGKPFPSSIIVPVVFEFIYN